MSGANGATEFTDVVGTLDELRALMGEPSEIALRKDIGRLDEHCRAFIARAPFVLVATADRAGRCDVSPKGDAPSFVLVVDDRTLLVPDRPGNKRFDGMRNLLENPGMGLLFLVPGSEETLRVNGRARIVRDPVWLAHLAAQGKTPQLAIAVDVEESFLHCAKCVKRSGLWEIDRWPDLGGLASPAQMFRDHGRVVGVDEDLAEAAPEGLLLRGVEALVTKEDHAVVEEGPSDRGHARRVEVGAQVDAVDLGAQRAGDGTDLDRHRSHVGSPGVAQYRFLR